MGLGVLEPSGPSSVLEPSSYSSSVPGMLWLIGHGMTIAYTY